MAAAPRSRRNERGEGEGERRRVGWESTVVGEVRTVLRSPDVLNPLEHTEQPADVAAVGA